MLTGEGKRPQPGAIEHPNAKRCVGAAHSRTDQEGQITSLDCESGPCAGLCIRHEHGAFERSRCNAEANCWPNGGLPIRRVEPCAAPVLGPPDPPRGRFVRDRYDVELRLSFDPARVRLRTPGPGASQGGPGAPAGSGGPARTARQSALGAARVPACSSRGRPTSMESTQGGHMTATSRPRDARCAARARRWLATEYSVVQGSTGHNRFHIGC